MSPAMSPWKENPLEEGRCYFWRIGSLEFWVKRMKDEWLEAHEHCSERYRYAAPVIARLSDKPRQLAWNRLISGSGAKTLRLTPRLPDRPVVVFSGKTVKVLPSGTALFFITVPLWISLSEGKLSGSEIAEIPSFVLSNTWFGGLTNGELAFSLKTNACTSLDDLVASSNEIVCPVHVRNIAPRALDFKRLCIHVEHLRIFKGPSMLWTNDVVISFEGEELPSNVRYGDSAPAYEGDTVLLSRERTAAERSIFKKSFSFLRYFTTTE